MKKKRIQNAHLFDKYLGEINEIITVKRNKKIKEVFHLYHLNVKHSRDKLIKYLNKNLMKNAKFIILFQYIYNLLLNF